MRKSAASRSVKERIEWVRTISAAPDAQTSRYTIKDFTSSRTESGHATGKAICSKLGEVSWQRWMDQAAKKYGDCISGVRVDKLGMTDMQGM